MKWRSEFSQNPKRIVVKIGSAGVGLKDGQINKAFIRALGKDIANLQKANVEVVIVTSGAINTGTSLLKSLNRNEISNSQALAAVGQPILMNTYIEIFKKLGLLCSQNLLIHDDLRSKKRAMNTRNCLFRLLENKVVPIINENDSVSYEEITSGDNDQLAVLVADVVGADALILLTEANGVYLTDPKLKESKPLSQVQFGEKLEITNFGKTKAGRGGITMKITAAQKLTRLGECVIISSFKEKKPLLDCLVGGKGTFFLPNKEKIKNRRKAWIASLVKNDAKIMVDAGAHQVLLKKGSLLPVGIIKVQGSFKRGDCVRLYFEKECFAQGLVEFSSEEVKLIQGKKSSEIDKLVKDAPTKLVIHRDNLYIGK